MSQKKHGEAFTGGKRIGQDSYRDGGWSRAVVDYLHREQLQMTRPQTVGYRRCQAETPLIVLCRFPGPALSAPTALMSLK
jgi:hypothetical protein